MHESAHCVNFDIVTTTSFPCPGTAWESTGSGHGHVVAQAELASILRMSTSTESDDIWSGEIDRFPTDMLELRLRLMVKTFPSQ